GTVAITWRGSDGTNTGAAATARSGATNAAVVNAAASPSAPTARTVTDDLPIDFRSGSPREARNKERKLLRRREPRGVSLRRSRPRQRVPIADPTSRPAPRITRRCDSQPPVVAAYSADGSRARLRLPRDRLGIRRQRVGVPARREGLPGRRRR